MPLTWPTCDSHLWLNEISKRSKQAVSFIVMCWWITSFLLQSSQIQTAYLDATKVKHSGGDGSLLPSQCLPMFYRRAGVMKWWIIDNYSWQWKRWLLSLPGIIYYAGLILNWWAEMKSPIRCYLNLIVRMETVLRLKQSMMRIKSDFRWICLIFCCTSSVGYWI